MKALFLVLTAYFISISSSLAAHYPPTEITSSIEKVTVFLKGASIERTATVSVKAGQNKIVFNNLSPAIIANSIQFKGLKNASVLAINFNIDFLDKKEQSAAYTKLNSELDVLLFDKNNIQNTISGYERELKLLDNNQRINSDQTDLSLEKIKQISAYYRERSTAINNAIYKERETLAELDKKIRDYNLELQKLNDTRREKRGEITLKLDAEQTSTLDINISYTITDAGWFPIYDIRADNTSSPISLKYKGNVYQQSGVDWEDVKLVLSTGDPNTNNIKPDLATKYLNFVSPYYKKASATNRSNYKFNPTIRTVSGIVLDESGTPLPGTSVLVRGTNTGTTTDFDGNYTININGGQELAFSYVGFNTEVLPVYSSVMNVNMEESHESLDEVVVVGYGVQRDKKALGYAVSDVLGSAPGVKIRGISSMEPAQYNETVEAKEESLTNIRFTIKKSYTIVSSNEVTTIEIDDFELPASYQHYAAPELNENVFLTATVTDWEKYDLLYGEANIYFDGSYAGKTEINPIATTDSLEVSMGIDPNVIVTREKLDNFKSKSFLGGNRVIQQGYKIEVKNNKSTAINLLLEDRIPISQNKEIKVDDVETGDSKYNTETGIMQWKLDLATKATTKKEFSYEVRYPKNRHINL